MKTVTIRSCFLWSGRCYWYCCYWKGLFFFPFLFIHFSHFHINFHFLFLPFLSIFLWPCSESYIALMVKQVDHMICGQSILLVQLFVHTSAPQKHNSEALGENSIVKTQELEVYQLIAGTISWSFSQYLPSPQLFLLFIATLSLLP